MAERKPAGKPKENKGEGAVKQKPAVERIDVLKEVRAIARYIPVSAYKLRQVADLVRGKQVEQAATILEFTPKESARILLKVVNSAVANAERNDHLLRSDLYIHQLRVDEGPTLKRWRPRAQGRYGPIRKRGCHIAVVLKQAQE